MFRIGEIMLWHAFQMFNCRYVKFAQKPIELQLRLTSQPKQIDHHPFHAFSVKNIDKAYELYVADNCRCRRLLPHSFVWISQSTQNWMILHAMSEKSLCNSTLSTPEVFKSNNSQINKHSRHAPLSCRFYFSQKNMQAASAATIILTIRRNFDNRTIAILAFRV